MKYLNRYAVTLLVLFSLYYIFNFLQLVHHEAAVEAPVEFVDDFESLKVKIEYLQTLVDSKQNDIANLKEAFAANIKHYNNLVEKQKRMLTKLKELNSAAVAAGRQLNSSHADASKGGAGVGGGGGSELGKQMDLLRASSEDIELPSAIRFLPHLEGKYSLVQPKFKQSKNRFASVSIGVPTIKREKTSYLLETLKSLFDAMNELEKTEALVVVMIAEMDDAAFVQTTVENINKAFKDELAMGALDIVVPPLEFYPDFGKMANDKVFNDTSERVKWRTKQNYDFSYLMTYCQRRSLYYLQLEDDVVSKTGFLGTILKYIDGLPKSSDWMMIEFSQLGFIGKLFKCNDLSTFVNFFLMFANDKPVDWLYESVFDVKTCNPERGGIHCDRSKTDLKIKYKPSLFQHVGFQSSLKGKTQKLKDKDFGKQLLIVAHDNPSAKFSTSLKTYMKYTLESAYLGQNYFWSMSPKANDYILFEFEEPALVNRYYVKSGNPEHPDDKLFNATFQIKFSKPVRDETLLPTTYIKTQDDFYIIDQFSDELGTVAGQIDGEQFGPLHSVRIHIASASENWVILSEIDFSSKKSADSTSSLANGGPRADNKKISN